MQNRKTRYLDLGCKLAARRNLLSWPQRSSQDCRAKRVVDLLVQRHSRSPINRNDWRDSDTKAAHCAIIVASMKMDKMVMFANHFPCNNIDEANQCHPRYRPNHGGWAVSANDVACFPAVSLIFRDSPLFFATCSNVCGVTHSPRGSYDRCHGSPQPSADLHSRVRYI